MPMIDPHVHLRDWDQWSKETLLHGMTVAKKAGFTHLFDMPNTSPAIVSREMVMERLATASIALKSVKGMHYHLYGGLTANPEQIKEMVDVYNELFPLVVGLKLFAGQSTGNMGIVDIQDQKKVFKTLVDAGYEGVLAVHSEKESLLKPEKFVQGRWETHSLARPEEAEVESISDIIEIATATGFKGNVHIAHISTAKSVEIVKNSRDKLRITMGATPHHALYSIKDAEVKERYLKMNPPLRSEKDRDAIFSYLLDGTIDWVESDHAPHTLEDKEKGASGIPGFAGMLLLADRLRKSGASEERLKSLYGLKVASVFGLEEDNISVPKDLKKRFDQITDEYPIAPFEWK